MKFSSTLCVFGFCLSSSLGAAYADTPAHEQSLEALRLPNVSSVSLDRFGDPGILLGFRQAAEAENEEVAALYDMNEEDEAAAQEQTRRPTATPSRRSARSANNGPTDLNSIWLLGVFR